jgi:hypothetical protein
MHVTCVSVSTPPVEDKRSQKELLKSEVAQHPVNAVQLDEYVEHQHGAHQPVADITYAQ